MNNSLVLPATEDPKLLEHALDLYGAKCEADWLRRRGLSNYTSQFLEQGYFVAPIPRRTAKLLDRYFTTANRMVISSQSKRDDYLNARLDDAVATSLNEMNTYYDQPSADVVAALEEYFETRKDEIEAQLAHGWEITNVRAWSVKPKAEYGPNTWHADHFSRYMRKFLIFLNPPNIEAGSTEITTRKNEVKLLEAATPVCVLYDTNVLCHRGRSPRSGERPMIEVTIVPAQSTSTKCVFAGQLGRAPWSVANDVASEIAQVRYVQVQKTKLRIPSARKIASSVPNVVAGIRRRYQKARSKSKANRARPDITNLTGRLNIGGGRKWQHRGWINLEGATGPKNPFPFWFSPDAIFPVPSSSVQLVYSSHCLEHLDDGTVEQALKEARRVLSIEGQLVLKLPDFDEALARWRKGDERYFRETIRLRKVVGTWQSRGVKDSIDNRASYIFCGFWNEAFGHNFMGKDNRESRHPKAYNGPAIQTERMARELIALESPHEIAIQLRKAVIDSEEDYTFNHQNGWSRKELDTLLAECGFRVQTFDAKKVVQSHTDVPGIALMEDLSMYCLAVPV